MENFTPYSALFGGALIGIAASLMLLLNGRVAGVSGIIGGLFRFPITESIYRLTFLGGLLAGGLLLLLAYPTTLDITEIPRSTSSIVVAGLLVGFGTRMSAGCTSGHGVCGISRFSLRSIVATLTFMAAGFIIVAIIGQLLEGQI